MTDSLIPKDHTSITTAPDFIELCQPIFDYTEIDSCFYGRVYPDNSLFFLDTHQKWHQYLYRDFKFKTQLSGYDLFDIAVEQNKGLFQHAPNEACWFIDDTSQEIIFQQSKEFAINNFINFGEKFSDYIELYGFAFLGKKRTNSYYFSLMELLKKFILYFREKGSAIIAQNEADRIILPSRDAEYLRHVSNLKKQLFINDDNIAKFHDSINLKKYPLIFEGRKKYITAKELQCLQHLSQGYSCKEIANNLGISPRTVEFHLNNSKDKLEAFSKAQLLNIFRDSNLSNIKV